jgi:hypothetical protein
MGTQKRLLEVTGICEKPLGVFLFVEELQNLSGLPSRNKSVCRQDKRADSVCPL